MTAKYRLTKTHEADTDLEHIYEEGILEWGLAQADAYYDTLLAHFDLLCEKPRLFRAVDEIKEGYRRSACGKHSIYYRIIDDTVEIVGLIKHQERFRTN